MTGAVSTTFGLMVPHDKLNACVAVLEEGLLALRVTPYHEVLNRDFFHLIDAAADHMIDFHRKAFADIQIAAFYFEMNGFTINPDRWYCDGFGYKTAGDIWDLDWLAYWDAETDRQFTLTGMESVQKAFADVFCDENQPLSVKMAAELADHLVTARFMQLIAAAHDTAKEKYKPLDGLPVLATAHDWDTVHKTI